MTRTRIFAAAAVVATAATLGSALGASAQSVDIFIPINEVQRGPVGSTIRLAEVEVDEALQGVPCSLEITAQNQKSVHPNNDIIFDSGSHSIAFEDVEGSAFQVFSETVDNIVLGPLVILSLRLGEDEVFSAGFHAIIDCDMPAVTVPDSSVPDTTTPDTTNPDTTAPDTTNPDTTNPDTTNPDTTLPEPTVPGTDDPPASTDAPTTTIDLSPTSSAPDSTAPAATVPDSSDPDGEPGDEPDDSVPDSTPPVATLPATTVPGATTMPPVTLPDTGSETSSTMWFAVASLIGGLGLLAVARRRTIID